MFTYTTTGPDSEVIKLSFILNSAEHEIFSANKYENANALLFFFFFFWGGGGGGGAGGRNMNPHLLCSLVPKRTLEKKISYPHLVLETMSP